VGCELSSCVAKHSARGQLALRSRIGNFRTIPFSLLPSWEKYRAVILFSPGCQQLRRSMTSRCFLNPLPGLGSPPVTTAPALQLQAPVLQYPIGGCPLILTPLLAPENVRASGFSDHLFR
jgi:hypothetical protein